MRRLLRTVRRHPRFCSLLALLAVGAGAVWSDATSLEKANRMYREGQLPRAIRSYRERLAARASGDGALVTYNLGTAWMTLGAPTEAETELAAAHTAEDSAVRFRALYNYAHLQYAEALKLSDRNMSARLLGEAVLAYRDALRTDPTSDDARWNLALAMEALDSVTLQPTVAMGFIPTREDSTYVVPVADTSTPGSEYSVASGEELMSESGIDGDGSRGARETLLDPSLQAPASLESSLAVLEEVSDSTVTVLRRILWLGGPKGWFGGDPGTNAW